jgi:hypothetical protein
MKAYGWVDSQIHIFLTSALVGGEWLASHPCRFTPGAHWIGGWVGPQSRSGRRGENSWPYPDSNSDPSVVEPATSRYTDWAIPATHLTISVKDALLSASEQLQLTMWDLFLTPVPMKITLFWNVTPCSLVERQLSYVRICCLELLGRNPKVEAAGSSENLVPVC